MSLRDFPKNQNKLVHKHSFETKIIQNGPPKPNQMNDRQLIKQQFYLGRFLYYLSSNNNLPTLPSPQVLHSIKKQNEMLEEAVQEFRNGTYQENLRRKILTIKKETQIALSSLESYDRPGYPPKYR